MLQRITQLEVGTADVKRSVDTLVMENVFRWLAAPDPASNHEAAQEKRELETGLWLTGHADYKEWRDGTSPMLWLNGNRELFHSVFV
jgi:hypothetical protein